VEDARTRLIASTQELLWERGYPGTSPRAIQDAAGVGQGSMYHHFTGKADLARAAVRRAAEGALPGHQVLTGPGSPLERIRAFLRMERAVLRGCPIGRLVQDREVVEDPELRGPIDAVFSTRIDMLAAVLREGQAAGEVRADADPEQVATMLLAVIQGGYVVARAHQDEARYAAAVEGALSLVTAGPDR
jgi:TetR/AcrR family transcriptional regulator, transcriptional repressor for nem operon